RAAADFFEELYPGLDVDNVINLSLLSASVNLRNRDYFVPSAEALHHIYGAKAVVAASRLVKMLEARARPEKQRRQNVMLSSETNISLRPAADKIIGIYVEFFSILERFGKPSIAPNFYSAWKFLSRFELNKSQSKKSYDRYSLWVEEQGWKP